MTMTVGTALVNNQNILQNFGLVEEIDEQSAEIISGGKKFTIVNNTPKDIYYTMDDAVEVINPGQTQSFDTDFGGTIGFDKDIRQENIIVGRKILKDGRTYQFKPDASGDPNMIELV
ncbi:MAG: hypothetical protein V7L22_01190 [Nostoc sp.]|uniref:hypothetical protein n=1 Tax=Nostoc sp. TaxID=1180 RepID=UPI002FFB9AA4